MQTLVRLLSFLRPYRAQVIVTAVSAAGLMACTATIPWLTRIIIDDALVDGRRSLLVPLITAVIGVGLA